MSSYNDRKSAIDTEHADVQLLKNEHKQVTTKRSNLDVKMREMYNDKVNDVMIDHNSVLYANLAFTILGTTLLYFLFVKK